VSLFDGPEYASYIALCRELRLERTIEPGDWSADFGDVFMEEPALQVHVARPPGTASVTLPRDTLAITSIWLPRLDQWLAMLEEAGADCPEFDRETTTGHYVLRRGMPDEWGHSQYGTGPTREEAAARLWVIVTRTEVASGQGQVGRGPRPL
jgi:hypothetical protein